MKLKNISQKSKDGQNIVGEKIRADNIINITNIDKARKLKNK